MALPKWLNSNPLVATVQENDVAYFINKEGQELDIGRFQYADRFSCGWACVNLGGDRVSNPQGVIGGNFRFINPQGEYLPLRFDEAAQFTENRGLIKSANTTLIIDEEGNQISDLFTEVLPYCNGLAAAYKGNALGYINQEGEWEFQMKSGDIIDSFKDGIARIVRGGKNGFVNPAGQWLIELTEDKIYAFSEKKAAFQTASKYGFINDNGEPITKAIFEDCADFREGYAAVKQNNKWGFINEEGNIVIPCIYENVRSFSEGRAAIMKGGKVGYIDKENKIIIDLAFDAAYDFKNNIAIYQDQQKVGYITDLGDPIIPTKYDRANYFVLPEENNLLLRIN